MAWSTRGLVCQLISPRIAVCTCLLWAPNDLPAQVMGRISATTEDRWAERSPDPFRGYTAELTFSGPMLGYAAGSRDGSLYPLRGIPGTAWIGEPVELGLPTAAIVPSPSQTMAIVIRTDSLPPLLISLEGEYLVMAEFPEVPSGIGSVAWSPSGDGVAFYLPSERRAVLYHLAPQRQPLLVAQFQLPVGEQSPPSLAISDGARALLMLFYEPERTPPEIARFVDPAASLVTVSGSFAVASFLRGAERAIVVEAQTGRLHMLDTRGEVLRFDALSDTTEAPFEPIAIQASADGRQVYVADRAGRSVVAYSLENGSQIRVPCGCRPERLERLALSGWFQLTEPGSGPFYLLDGTIPEPRIVPVPSSDWANRLRGPVRLPSLLPGTRRQLISPVR